MRRLIRENAACAALAAAGVLATAWLGLYGYAWSDYEVESRPAFEALAAGHLGRFLTFAPIYGGSLIERAPFALLPGLWNGGPLAVYRLVAAPCLLAVAVLGVWLVALMRAEGRPRLARAVTLGVCVANPVTLLALEVGHPEELLGAALCVMAVLLACSPGVSRRRALAAGLLLGLAVANKQWALLAVAPVLLALPPGRRLGGLLAAAGTASAVELPLVFGSTTFLARASNVATPSSMVFQPWQLWWFLGRHGALVHGLFGNAEPGYRTGPPWTGTLSHPLILLVGAALGAWLAWRCRRAPLAVGPALLALALALLLRCLLDTWDTAYYLIGPIFALAAWEARRRNGSQPFLALAVTVLTWTVFHWLPGRVSPDVQSIAFLAWALPLAAWLGVELLRELRERPAGERAQPSRRAAQGTTVSSFGSPVRTMLPSAVTAARSSIRTPSSPGR